MGTIYIKYDQTTISCSWHTTKFIFEQASAIKSIVHEI